MPKSMRQRPLSAATSVPNLTEGTLSEIPQMQKDNESAMQTIKNIIKEEKEDDE